MGKGQRLHVFALPPKGVDAFKAFRAAALPKSSHGSLSVDAAPCLSGAKVPDRVPITIFVLTEELSDYTVFMPRRDLMQENDAAGIVRGIRPCADAS